MNSKKLVGLFLIFFLFGKTYAEDKVPTYVLNDRIKVRATCPELTAKFHKTFIEELDAKEKELLAAWEILCGETTQGETPVEIQIVIEPRSLETLGIFQDYLAAHQKLQVYSTEFVFRRASTLDERLEFQSGMLQSDEPWVLKVLYKNRVPLSFASYGAYRAFYARLTTAMWFNGPNEFAAYLGDLFGKEFGVSYLKEVMPVVNVVQTKTSLNWTLEDGTKVASLMIYDILRDCRTRENGRCR